MPIEAEPYVVDVRNAKLAVSIDDLNLAKDKVDNLSKIVQPVFFTASRDKEGNWSNKKFYEAVPCE